MRNRYIILLLLAVLFTACKKDASIPDCFVNIEQISVDEHYTSSELQFRVKSSVENYDVSCVLTPVEGGEMKIVTPQHLETNAYKLSCSDVDGFNYNVSFVLNTEYDTYNCPEIYNFKTKEFQKPEVTTNNVDDKANEPSVTFKGTITDKGGRTISKYGFCFCHGENTPTIDDFVVESSTLESNGKYSYKVNQLEQGRTYTVCAFAINDRGIGYGNPKTFQKQ